MKKILFLCVCLYSYPLFGKHVIPVIPSDGHYVQRATPITILIMHYTEEDLETTLSVLTAPDTIVSSHYVIGEKGKIFQLIHQEDAARHAGDSYWNGLTGRIESTFTLNHYSLGIEHVNLGYKKQETQPSGILRGDREWYPFREEQIQASIQLAKELVTKYAIKPENIVAHSDVAPSRKIDPGPLFPWERFAQAGVGAWPDLTQSHELACFTTAEDDEKKGNTTARATWVMDHLHHWGYKKPDEQATAQDIVRSFQMHFRPDNIDGIIDYETATILKALISQYKKCACANHQ